MAIDFGGVYLSASEVASIVGLTPNVVTHWLAERWIGGPKDRRAKENGATTYLGVDTAVALAIAAKLRQMGASPQIACKAGKAFSALVAPSVRNSSMPEDWYSWLIVYSDGEISAVSLKQNPDAKPEPAREADLWQVYWPKVIHEIVQQYAFQIGRLRR